MRLAFALTLAVLVLPLFAGCARRTPPPDTNAGGTNGSPDQEGPSSDQGKPLGFAPDDARRTLRWLEELSRPARYPTGNPDTDEQHTAALKKALQGLPGLKVRWRMHVSAVALPGQVRFEPLYTTHTYIMPRPGPPLCGLALATLSRAGRSSLLPAPKADWLSKVKERDPLTVAGTISEVPCSKGGEAWEFLFVLDKISIST
jgi:hypothetical protein